MRTFIHVFQTNLASYTTDECFKPWMEFLSHIHLFIRAESNPKYDQTVITIAWKHGINTACAHTAKDLFKKMWNDSSQQDEMRFLHQAILIFKGPLKHATWIHDIRMNVQEKFNIKIVQMLFSPELGSCDSDELKQRFCSWNHNSSYKQTSQCMV